MALIKCKKCGNDVIEEAVICPNCGFLSRSVELPKVEKPKRKPRAPSKKVKTKENNYTKPLLIATSIIALAVVVSIVFLMNNGFFNEKKIAKPINPEIIKKYSSNARSSALDARTTVFATVKNHGGPGKARLIFAVYQSKYSYTRDTVIALREEEKMNLHMTFREVRLVDGDVTFDATVTPL